MHDARTRTHTHTHTHKRAHSLTHSLTHTHHIIGTSVTNSLVSMGQISDRNQFRRAFAGATVHDMFNFLSVLVLLPIEYFTHYLRHISELTVSSLNVTEGSEEMNFLKVRTRLLLSLTLRASVLCFLSLFFLCDCMQLGRARLSQCTQCTHARTPPLPPPAKSRSRARCVPSFGLRART